MIRPLPPLLALWFGLAAFPLGAAPVPIENPGFEEGLAAWTVLEPDEAMSTAAAEAAHEGTAGLRVVDDSESLSSKVLSSPVPVSPGKTYRLTFWARTETGNRLGVFFRFHTGEGKMFGQEDRPYRNVDVADGQWTQYTLEAAAPPDAASLLIWIHSYSKMTGQVDLDDFVLEELDKPSGTAPSASIPAAPAPAGAGPRTNPAKIIIKADDLRVHKGGIHPRWQKFIDFVKQRQIKAGIGIICDSLDGDHPQYFQAIKDLQVTGLFEFWNHGYDHREWMEGDKKVFEFQGSSYDHQKQHLTRSNELAREKLGIVFQTFGPPYAVADANTVKVLEEAPDIKVWLYGKPLAPSDPTAGKVILDRLWDVSIENPLFTPSAEKFMAGYARYPQRDYFVIQGHPSRWDDARFAEFEKIIDFLIQEGATFVTPAEYALEKAGAPGLTLQSKR